MIKELNSDETKAEILLNLIRDRRFGGRHTSIKHAAKGLDPQHVGKRGHKRIMKLVHEMIKDGLIIKKPTHYGLQISLNHRMSFEIKNFVKKTLGYDLEIK